jgi:hypothetical protein
VTPDDIPNPNALKIATSSTARVQDWTTERHDLRRADDHRVSQRQHDPRPRHRDPHRHAAGRRHGRKPPLWLKAGDSVSIEIEKIGTLTNPVVNERAAARSGSR